MGELGVNCGLDVRHKIQCSECDYKSCSDGEIAVLCAHLICRIKLIYVESKH